MTLKLEYPTPTEVLKSLHNANATLDGLSPVDFESAFVDYDPRAPRSGCILELKDGPLLKFLEEQRPFCAETTTRAGIKDRVRLEDWYLRARLRGTNRTPSSYMVLPAADCTSEDLLSIQRTLSCFTGYQSRYHVFELDDQKGAGVGFELIRSVNEAALLPQRIHGARIYELRRTSQSGWHCLPLGWSHPFIDDFSFLLPSTDQHTAVRVWNHDGTCSEFVRDTVLPEDGVRLADHVQWRAYESEDSARSVASGAHVLQDKIRVELQQGSEWGSPVGSAVPVAVVVQCSTSGGRLSRDLLGRLDDEEAGAIHNATYYGIPGEGPFGQSKHFIRYPVGTEWKPERRLGTQTYVQYKIFQDLGLEIFVEEGCRFSPDLRTVLDGLSRDHELVVGMLRDFSQDDEGEKRIYLLRWQDDVRPSRDVLTGGSPLVDVIGQIVFQDGFNHVVEQTSSLTNEVKQCKQAAVEALSAATADDVAVIRKEFDAVIKSLQTSLAGAEDRLRKASARIESIRSETAKLEPDSDAAEKRWNEIVDRVHALFRQLVEPRHKWIKDVEARMAASTKMAESKKKNFHDLANAAAKRLREIGQIVDACESLAEKIENSKGKAAKREAQSKGLVTRANDALKVVEKELNARSTELDAEQQKFSLERGSLERRQTELEQRREQLRETRAELDRLKSQLDAEEERLNSVEGQIKTEQKVASKKKADLEEKQKSLPGLRSRRDEIQAEVKSLIATGVEQDHAKVTSDLSLAQAEAQRLLELQTQLSSRTSKLQVTLGTSESRMQSGNALRQEVESLTEQLQGHVVEIQNIDSEVENVKFANTTQKTNWLDRIDVLISEIKDLPIEIEQPKEDETADVVVEDSNDATEMPKSRSLFNRLFRRGGPDD